MSAQVTASGTDPLVLVLMGVSGCGKTTIAALLAGRFGWDLEEGDGLHPQSNVAKMHAGHPLTDEDRWPWLEKVAEWIEGQLDAGKNGVITCSALKRSYRDILNRRGAGVLFIYLSGSPEVIRGQADCAPRPFHALEPAGKPVCRPRGADAGRALHPGRRRSAAPERSSEEFLAN